MVTATAVLGGLLVETHEANVRQLQRLAARSLLEEARAELPAVAPEVRRWWIVDDEGRARPRGGHAEPIDAGSRALASQARERGAPLLQAGRPWEPVRFAAPEERGVFVDPAAAGGIRRAAGGASAGRRGRLHGLRALSAAGAARAAAAAARRGRARHRRRRTGRPGFRRKGHGRPGRSRTRSTR